MSIDSLSGIEPGDLFTITGKDVWQVESMCESPTITLKNLETGKRRGGAVGCLNLQPFVPLKPTVEIAEAEGATPAVYDIMGKVR